MCTIEASLSFYMINERKDINFCPKYTISVFCFNIWFITEYLLCSRKKIDPKLSTNYEFYFPKSKTNFCIVDKMTCCLIQTICTNKHCETCVYMCDTSF
ncbi:hypothetical protein BpHYR1_046114 [Brachionus plicatilis]|uniref:Uncharacterized protein n=1 Tax=Brachionus plicatilis TaxID=10195 RepID=A0A3M7QNE0_BRAPC|nr:hypothetical protein BpHYR1_046114 [Brachionus plicatilis]